MTDAEQRIHSIKKNELIELCSIVNPPMAIVSLFEALGILFQPDTPSDEFVWTAARRLVRRPDFIKMFFDFDKDHIQDEQLTRLECYLARDDMQPERMTRFSRIGGHLLAWIRAMLNYGRMRQAC